MKNKKLRHVVAALLPLLSALPAGAETLHYNQVEFRESASVRVPNDTMNVALRITEKAKTRQEASQAVTRRLNAVVARFKDKRRFESETTDRRVYPEYDDKGRITGWRDTAEVRVSSTDFEALSKQVAASENDAMLARLYYSVSPQKRAAAIEEASDKVLKAFSARAQQLSRSLGFGGNYKIIKLELNSAFDQAESSVAHAAPMAARLRSAKAQLAEVMDSNPGEQAVHQSINASIQMQ